MNKQWNGKEFGIRTHKNGIIGINRFYPNGKNGCNDATMEKVHNFDYAASSPSIFGNTSIQLNYSRHQGIFSLWKTMVDEVRILEIPSPRKQLSNGTEQSDFILLGVGSMAWSGGMYNCQPFVLKKSLKS
jgi:hypothetical protein